jgi:hypothetical protein
MKYRYFPEYGKLLPLPEPLKPIYYESMDCDCLNCKAFAEWLSKGIPVPDEHLKFFEVDRDESEFEVWRFNSLGKNLAIPKKGNESQTPCNGKCGMNYCDEYGCIENKPEGDVSHLLVKPTAPHAPQSVPIIPGSAVWTFNRKQELSKQGLLKEEIIATMKKEFAEWRKVGNESKEQSPSVDLDQVVYVPSFFKPTKYRLLKVIEGGTEIDHGFVKKTTIRELIHQPYK